MFIWWLHFGGSGGGGGGLGEGEGEGEGGRNEGRDTCQHFTPGSYPREIKAQMPNETLSS